MSKYRRCSYSRHNSVLVFVSILLLNFTSPIWAADHETIRLVVSTSVVNSGLMKKLVSTYQAQHQHNIAFFPTGSGNALRLARLGKADLLVTHVPDLEKNFIKEGYGKERYKLMTNEFVLIGPKADPAEIEGIKDIKLALKKIADKRAKFISRGDYGGTHRKELFLWQQVGIEPFGEWYFETGSGQSEAMSVASKKGAYILIDNGTWLALQNVLDSRLYIKGGELLSNLYSVITVNPKKHPQVNFRGATLFMNWLLSPQGKKVIQEFKVNGEQLFVPST